MSRRPLHATGQGQRVRVALVDDHVLLLDGLSARLSRPRTGVEVVATSPTWSGLVRDERFPAAFDVVVLDLALRDDVPVAQKIRTLAGVGLTSVLLSTHADASTIHGAMRAGAAAVVPKAESSEELIATIHAAADGTPRQTALVQQAMQDFHAEEDPRLGQQEQRALVLYAARGGSTCTPARTSAPSSCSAATPSATAGSRPSRRSAAAGPRVPPPRMWMIRAADAPTCMRRRARA
jgi:DNA-binding NarL/FixJ family response regulator